MGKGNGTAVDKRHTSTPGLGSKLNAQIDRAVRNWGKGDEKRRRALGAQ